MLNAGGRFVAAALLVASSAAIGAPLALVTHVRGEVWASAGATRRAVAALDWLEPGQRLTVGPAPSSLRLMLTDGARYELLPGARVSVRSPTDLAQAGVARKLTAVAAWPVALLAPPPPEFAQARGAALRIRARQLQLHAPLLGASVLADRPLDFAFEPVQGAGHYLVEVEGPDGRIVERIETTVGAASLPAGRLVPGRVYHWSVQSQGGLLGQARGRGVFRTLTTEDASRVTRLLRVAEDEDGAIFGAELQRQLGWSAAGSTRVLTGLEPSAGAEGLHHQDAPR